MTNSQRTAILPAVMWLKFKFSGLARGDIEEYHPSPFAVLNIQLIVAFTFKLNDGSLWQLCHVAIRVCLGPDFRISCQEVLQRVILFQLVFCNQIVKAQYINWNEVGLDRRKPSDFLVFLTSPSRCSSRSIPVTLSCPVLSRAIRRT